MKKGLKILVLASALLLQGCATSYQKMGLSGGFEDVALNKDTYIIRFQGNRFTSRDQVNTYLLRRGAELTKQNGYSHFVILGGSENVERKNLILSQPSIDTVGMGSSNFNGSVYGGNFSGHGSSDFHSSTTFNPGHIKRFNIYSSKMVIKMLKDDKKAPMALSADVILRNFAKNE